MLLDPVRATRSQALERAHDMKGTHWRDPIGGCRYLSGKMTSHRLVILQVNGSQLLMRCGNLYPTTDTRILMLKAVLLKFKVDEMFQGEKVTLQLIFNAITSIHKRFVDCCADTSKHAVSLKSYNFEEAYGCLTAGPDASHSIVQQGDGFSITRSHTPLKCFVIDQGNVPQMTEAEMNTLLISILAFCKIDFARQQQLSQADIAEQYKGITREVEFGTNNTKAYRVMMAQADLLRTQLQGGTTWIDQTQGEMIIPASQTQYRLTLPEMGPTTGAVYEGSYVTRWQSDW